MQIIFNLSGMVLIIRKILKNLEGKEVFQSSHHYSLLERTHGK